jgi:hypothetical protein
MIHKEVLTPQQRAARMLPSLLATIHVQQKDKLVCTLKVEGGLHYIRGNHAPYFSLTCENGADHQRILKAFPEFADIAALHLADIDGVPSHAASNAFYHMGGYTGFRPHPTGKYNDGSTIWSGGSIGQYGANWKHAANLLRITEDEAHKLANDTFGIYFSETGGFLTPTAEKQALVRLTSWCEEQKPRWKAEADACIAKHGLTVFGDKWISEREVV